MRPGIQCGLSVRGTFRVSQTVPVSIRSISLPGLLVWLPLGFPEACLKSTNPQFVIRKLSPFRLSRFSPFPPRHGAAAARLKDFPECTTLRSHRRHCRLQGSILEPLLFSAPHSQPCRSIHTLLTLLSPLRGASGKPVPLLLITSFLLRRHTPFHSLPGFAACSRRSSTLDYT